MSTSVDSASAIAPALSIVIPVRDEEGNIEPLARELLEVLFDLDIEIVFVDDGSRDGTFAEIRRLRTIDSRIRALRFRAGAGKASAYQEGFRAARGSLIATMDGDLQDDPRDIPRLIEQLDRGADIVVGWKMSGKSSPASFIVSRLGNAILRLFARPKLHDMNCPLRVMRSEVAKSLELRADLHRYIPMLATARGYKVAELPVGNRPRKHGSSKYGGSKYFTSLTAFLGVNLYLRFGERPMALFGGIGLLAFLAGFLIDAFYAARYLLFGQSIDDDFPTIVLGVLLILIGTQFLSLGLLAEIMIRRLRAVEDRTLSLVVEEL